MIDFIRIFIAMFVAEMGDKTQMLMIAMAGSYTLFDIIIGSGASIIALNAIAVAAGSFISSLIPLHIVKLIAAAAFLYFAYTSLIRIDEDESVERKKGTGAKFPILTIFWTFFIAEFGDKTQLTAITFAADQGASYAVMVCIACSLGLFCSDLIGMLIGDLLKRHMGQGFIDKLSFLLFFIFGIYTAYQALDLIYTGNETLTHSATLMLSVAFLLICIVAYRKKKIKTQ